VAEQGTVIADVRVEDEGQEAGDQPVRGRGDQVRRTVPVQQLAHIGFRHGKVRWDVHERLLPPLL
jgi:hypothetical protein